MISLSHSYAIRFYGLDMICTPKRVQLAHVSSALFPQLGELSRGIRASSIDKLIADSLSGTGL